ncbi:MAG: hypothetical protein KC517_05560 [Bacteroidetes bacterium]|nr:hypothetical protein [Bacteroidota bacterium]
MTNSVSMMNKTRINKYWIIGLFAIAMGLLECAVVVYLRELSFPNGFGFPLQTIGHNLAAVELWREVATLVMLITIGWLCGHNTNTRFGWFIYTFAIWDIFYYVFLKLFLNWPESLLTWDVLFLLPVMWVGPVWAPILLSLIMIVFTIVINHINTNTNRPIGRLNWALLISGSLICIVSFCIDFIRYSQNKIPNFSWTNLFSIEKTFNQFYVPADFPVAIFGLGLMLIVSGIIRYYHIHKISSSQVTLSQLF